MQISSLSIFRIPIVLSGFARKWTPGSSHAPPLPCLTLVRCRSLPVHEMDDASNVIIGFFRCVGARKRVMRAALSIYFRVYDEEYNTHFYVNQRTGESAWTKPRVLLTNEPMILLSEDQKKLKRSPRLNRERFEIENGNSQDPTD